MRVFSKLCAIAAVSMGMMLATAPAHAVTVIPLSPTLQLPSAPSDVIPRGTFVQNTNTYDLTFTTKAHIYDTLMQMQATNVKTGKPVSLAFELYSGLPGSGTPLAPSSTGTAATLLDILKPGDYYLQLKTVKAPKELLTGGVTLLAAVPEPATWAAMLMGLGLVGAGLRARRRAALAA